MGIGRIGASAADSIARQPEAAKDISGGSLILAAFIEGYTSEQYIDNLLDLLMAARGTPLADGGVHFSSAQSFKGWVERELGVTLKDTVLQAVTTESEVFRIESVGEVGDSRVEIKAIIDYSTNPIGQFVYWKVE